MLWGCEHDDCTTTQNNIQPFLSISVSIRCIQEIFITVRTMFCAQTLFVVFGTAENVEVKKKFL